MRVSGGNSLTSETRGHGQGTYAEDLLLEENRPGDVGLEFSLGGCGFPAKELFTRRLLDQVLLPVDDVVVVVGGLLVDARAVDEEV